MFKTKFIISTTLFIIFLIITSTIKNNTRLIEKKISNLNPKILLKKKDLNESQLEFYYLSSPSEIEKKLKNLGFNNYRPIKHSNIFFDITNFTRIQNKVYNLKNLNQKKIKKK